MDDLINWLRQQIHTISVLATDALAEWPPGDEIASQVESIVVGAHIARNDPRAVLAECEAKRRIINDVIPEVNGMDDRIEGEWGHGLAGPHEESKLLLSLLALPYADRPGYREEWKP